MRFAFAVDGGQLPLDNHHNENQIRPIAVGRNNWLFAGGLRAGKRAAAVKSLTHSAKLNERSTYYVDWKRSDITIEMACRESCDIKFISAALAKARDEIFTEMRKKDAARPVAP